MRKNNNCWWLSDTEIAIIEKSKLQAINHVPVFESHFDISKQLNEDADVFMPVSEDTGWRSSDIDLLQNPSTDPRLVNSIQSRLQRPAEPSNDGISDDLLETAVIDRDFTPQDSLNLARTIRSGMDSIAADSSIPAVEPPKTE